MTTQTAGEKARKLAARLQTRRAALVKAMRSDICQLRQIIHRRAGKQQASV
jgi:hypothetical protein